MARLVAFGGKNGHRDLDALYSVDFEAIAIIRSWGVGNGHKPRTVDAVGWLASSLLTQTYNP